MRENRTVLALTGAFAIALILLGMAFGLAGGESAQGAATCSTRPMTRPTGWPSARRSILPASGSGRSSA